MSKLNISLFGEEDRKDFLKLPPFASWTGAMIDPQWLELPISRTNFHGLKQFRAIEVWLYVEHRPTLFAQVCLSEYLGQIW